MASLCSPSCPLSENKGPLIFLALCRSQTNSGSWGPAVIVREHPGVLGHPETSPPPWWAARVVIFSSRPTVKRTESGEPDPVHRSRSLFLRKQFALSLPFPGAHVSPEPTWAVFDHCAIPACCPGHPQRRHSTQVPEEEQDFATYRSSQSVFSSLEPGAADLLGGG